MPHPKKKTTKAAQNQRRSHHALKATNLAKCESCGKPVKPHHACLFCGKYKGREVIDITKKLPRKEQIRVEKKKVKEENRELKKIQKESDKAQKTESKDNRKEGMKSVVRGDK